MIKPALYLLSLLGVSMLASCTLAPHYTRPEAPIAATYPAPASSTNNAETAINRTDNPTGDTKNTGANNAATHLAQASELGWRNFFTDPRLQMLIATALDNNRDLRIAALRIEEARALYNIQSADLLPNVNGQVSGSHGRVAATLSPTRVSTVGRSYQVGLSLASFELDFFGRVRSLNDAALAQYLASDEARQAAQISLIAETAKAYLAERAFDEQFLLAQKTLNGRESAYGLAKQRFEAGASSALDLRQNEALLGTTRVALATLTRQRAQASNALTLLTGKPLTELPAAQALGTQGIIAELPAGLPAELLTQRPDIRAAEQRLLAANANIGAARAAFFPRISLTAALGTASSTLSGLFDAGSRTWSFIPQLSLPIFDAGRNSNNLDLSHVRKNIAVADYEKSIQVAFREVADALVARASFNEQVEAQQSVTTAQSERLRLVDLRFKNGVANSLEVLDAQRELFSAEQTLVQTHVQRLNNAIDLYRSLGGGVIENTAVKR